MERLPQNNNNILNALLRLFGFSKKRKQYHLSQQMTAIQNTNAIIEYDMNGNIISANDYFLKLMGYYFDELQGKNISSITKESNMQWEDIRLGKNYHYELPHISKKGVEHWFQSSFNIIRDRNDYPCKILECAMDINEQKKLSLKSEYGEIKSNAITDSIIDAFIMIDQIGTIVRFNPAATKEFGYIEKEVIGQNIKILMPEPYYSEHDSYLHNYNTTQIAKIIGKKGREVKAKRKDGTLFVAEINISKMLLGKEIFFIGTIRNTTEKVEASKNIISGLAELEETLSSQSSSALEQAASVSEIVAIVEEIKSTSQQTLEKAKNLGSSAEQTLNEGVRGVQSCGALTTAMDNLQKKMQQISTTILSLSDKTQQIGEITDAVADIAKQSKMLALNASIEAAKAGESGKGFAVVASEVKELAERSEVSTSRVQKILQDIRKKTEQAVIATEEGTKSVDENINQLDLTTSIISVLANVIQDSSIASQQIVSAVKEESIGIEQVVQSIQEIDKVSNQFTAVTEQTKKAILMLNTVAHSLETKTKSE